ncbi:MAG: hypothetical protein WCJ59_03500, partial [bacterium]
MEKLEQITNQATDIVKSEEELRAKQTEKIVSFLEKIDAYDYFKNLLSNNIEKPNFNEFANFLVRINGIARNIPIHERNFDGKNVRLGSVIGDTTEVPNHEDKENLLRHAYEEGLAIDNEDLKYLLPAVINAVHLFSDGNGRTSRIIHLLLKGYSSKDEFNTELRNALGTLGRTDSFDINPSLILVELGNIVLKNNGWIFDKGISELGEFKPIKNNIASSEIRGLDKDNSSYEIAQKFLAHQEVDGPYVRTAIYLTLGDTVSDYINYYGDKKIARVSPKKLLETLKTE